MVWSNKYLYLGIASLSLLVAIAVYLFARTYPPEVLAPFLITTNKLASYPGVVGSAPSFFYTLSLGLFIGVCASNRTNARFHCLVWTGLAFTLELSQHPIPAGLISSSTTTYFSDPIGTLFDSYWSHGTFDPMDLLATLMGGGIAFYLLTLLPLEKCHAHDH